MSNIQSYNALIDRFHAFASGHFILKRFSHGQIEVSDLEKFGEYPFMHVVPSNVSYAKGTKTFSFQIVLADLPRDKEDKPEYQREVLSDLQRIAEDLVAEITNHRVLFGDLITVQNVTLEPFLEEFQHTLTGWTISLDLLVPYYWDACSIPAEWNDMFESGSGGTGSILTFIDSINRDANGNVSLVNDEETPAPNYYYGTNGAGVRGWYLLTDEVGLTCETIGDCETIINIEAAIDALEEEILLKADITSISAVGFSNDYNDLDNKPTIPTLTSDLTNDGADGINPFITAADVPAQVNSDWNATSGVAEILNKPTLPATVGDMLKSVYDTDVDGVVDSAERIQIVVRNSTGSTLTKGQIVYLSGATGNRPNAVLAQADTEATSSKTIGMVIANIANNADGQVAVNGTLHDLDTSAFTAGDTLWLSASTAGGMVANTPPIEPNHAVFIGYVARSHPNQGRIVLAIQNGYELDELHGVLITTPANNEVLTYESSTSLWKNKTVATALGYTPENTANKQNSLAVDGTGVKFPTVDAVNNLSMIDRGKRMVSFFTDFLGTPATNLDGVTTFASGANASAIAGTSIPNRTNQQGVISITTTAATGYYSLVSNGSFSNFWFGNGVWNYETLINITNLSSLLERYRLVFGFGAGGGISAETDGAFITYDEGATSNGTVASPNWQCVTAANSVRTLTTTTTAVTTASWIKLRIEVNAAGTSVAFYLNGTLLATHTTNIPLPTNNRYFLAKFGIYKTIGVTSRVFYTDYLGYENILTTPRT